jgi:hypothetical protein
MDKRQNDKRIAPEVTDLVPTRTKINRKVGEASSKLVDSGYYRRVDD